MFAYTVACEFDDPTVATQWVEWLRTEHLADVCAAGAVDAEVVGQFPAASGPRA